MNLTKKNPNLKNYIIFLFFENDFTFKLFLLQCPKQEKKRKKSIIIIIKKNK